MDDPIRPDGAEPVHQSPKGDEAATSDPDVVEGEPQVTPGEGEREILDPPAVDEKGNPRDNLSGQRPTVAQLGEDRSLHQGEDAESLETATNDEDLQEGGIATEPTTSAELRKQNIENHLDEYEGSGDVEQ